MALEVTPSFSTVKRTIFDPDRSDHVPADCEPYSGTLSGCQQLDRRLYDRHRHMYAVSNHQQKTFALLGWRFCGHNDLNDVAKSFL